MSDFKVPKHDFRLIEEICSLIEGAEETTGLQLKEISGCDGYSTLVIHHQEEDAFEAFKKLYAIPNLIDKIAHWNHETDHLKILIRRPYQCPELALWVLHGWVHISERFQVEMDFEFA